MFCPECKAEYTEEIRKCSDCNVKLVAQLPEESHEAEFEYVKLMQTYNQADLAMVKSILDGAGITYDAGGQNFLSVGPLVQPVVVFVRDSQLKTARQLLKDLDLQYWGASVSSPEDSAENGGDEKDDE